MTDISRAVPASFAVRRPSRATLVIEIPGEVTSRSEPALTRAFEQASDEATGTVVLDFTRLEYLNSGGIGLLVTLLVRANRQRQRLIAFGLDAHHREIFSVTRLDEAIGLYDDETAALATAE